MKKSASNESAIILGGSIYSLYRVQVDGRDLVKYKRTIIVFLLILLLSACSPNPKLKIESEVDEVKVSFFKDFGSMNEDYRMVVEKKEDIKIFVNAIKKSSPLSGDVDMPEADYNLLLNFNDGTSEGFHLWLSREYSTGTIMKIDDTATAYKLGKSSADKIRAIIYR